MYSKEVIDEVNNIDLIKYVGNCIELQKKSDLFIGLCPFHNEKTPSFTLYPETNSYYCWGCGEYGNIIDFVKKYHNLSFTEAVEYLIKNNKIDIKNIHCQDSSIISYLQQYNRSLKQNIPKEHTILNKNIMNQYKNIPIMEWLQEGIQQEIMEKYQVRYNPKDNRAVFPIFDNKGNIIAVKGRTLYENFKDLGIRKYTYYQKIGDLDFLYGLCFNRDNIIKKNECICVEAEKSLWKLEKFGFNNVVSICTHDINIFQIKELLKLHTDITIAFDKDISLNQIKTICSKLIKFTNVYVVYDKNGLLEDKDAPCDKGEDVWNQLYKERIRLNEI